MIYEWDSNLETGNEQIDKQHKNLVIALNNIFDAFQQGKGREEIFNSLDFLTAYTIIHFTDEEELQIKYDYPGYSAHKKTHDDFKVTVENLTQRLKDEGPSEGLVVTVITTIGDWLLKHIRHDDLDIAVYIRSVQ